MFKKLIHIQKDIFYSPTHNTFFRLEPPSEQVDFGDYLLEISGHEEKIFEFLICNYNSYVSKETLEQEFPECADPYDKTLDRLRRDKIEGRLKLYGLIKKTQGRAILYLSESPFTAEERERKQDIPLLCRADYYVDYDAILSDCAPESGADTPQSILRKWIRDCGALPRYDEKCLMLLERIGFLPAFGKKADKLWFLEQAKALIYRFDAAEVAEYGGTELLLFARSAVLCVIEYIESQMKIILSGSVNADLEQQFTHLLQHFRTVRIPERGSINPLLLTAFYDYFGLTLYRCYLCTRDPALLNEAVQRTEAALENARKVDLHLQIWAAFLTYNLARLNALRGDFGSAVRNIQTAVILRQCLAESPFFTAELKQDLYFEYLLASIIRTDIERQAGQLTDDGAQAEYLRIRSDAAQCGGDSDRGDSQPYIRRLIAERLHEN